MESDSVSFLIEKTANIIRVANEATLQNKCIEVEARLGNHSSNGFSTENPQGVLDKLKSLFINSEVFMGCKRETRVYIRRRYANGYRVTDYYRKNSKGVVDDTSKKNIELTEYMKKEPMCGHLDIFPTNISDFEVRLSASVETSLPLDSPVMKDIISREAPFHALCQRQTYVFTMEHDITFSLDITKMNVGKTLSVTVDSNSFYAVELEYKPNSKHIGHEFYIAELYLRIISCLLGTPTGSEYGDLNHMIEIS